MAGRERGKREQLRIGVQGRVRGCEGLPEEGEKNSEEVREEACEAVRDEWVMRRVMWCV